MEGFRIDLKTFLGLAMPITNALKLSESKYQGGFGVIIWGSKSNPHCMIGANVSLTAIPRQ